MFKPYSEFYSKPKWLTNQGYGVCPTRHMQYHASQRTLDALKPVEFKTRDRPYLQNPVG